MSLEVLSWDEYFMSVAFLSSLRSVDPGHKGGTCIVNKDNRIVGIGYSGFPRGMDNAPPDTPDDTSLYICHSIMNAILNKNQYDIRGCRIYTSQFPCCECAKLIVQAGITRVIYSAGVVHDASRILFSLAGVSICQLGDTENLTGRWHNVNSLAESWGHLDKKMLKVPNRHVYVMIQRLSNDSFIVSLQSVVENPDENVLITWKRYYGDEIARKTVKSKIDSSTKVPRCLVRAVPKLGGKPFSTEVDAMSCALFQKRVSHVIKHNLLRSKPKKV